MENTLSQYFAAVDPLILWSGIFAFVVVVTILGVVVYRLKNPSDDKRIDNTIRELSTEFLKDAIISDGVYGYYFVDYLVLFPGQIILLGVQHFEGYIFGAENIDEWARVVNKKSYKFPNPLRSYVACAQTINSLIKDADVTARMVFTSQSEFPKGVPSGVYPMANFKAEMTELAQDKTPDAQLKAIWGQLVSLANEHKQQYQREKLQPSN